MGHSLGTWEVQDVTQSRAPCASVDLQEVALRAGREAARSAEEWGLTRPRAWEAGALVAVRALGEEAAAAGKPLDSIVAEALEVVKFIGNAGGGQESVKQAARALGRNVFQLELESGEPAEEAAARAAKFSAIVAHSGRLPRKMAGRLACGVAAAAMRDAAQGSDVPAAVLAVQDAACKAGQDAALDQREALEASCIEAGAAAGSFSRSSGASLSNAAREAGASALQLGTGKGIPASKAGRLAAQAAARCAAEAPGTLTRTYLNKMLRMSRAANHAKASKMTDS